MPKKPETKHIGPSSPKEYDEMALRLARMQAAGRQGKSPREEKDTKRALLIEQFDKQQQEIRDAEAKKKAQSIGQQLKTALQSLSPRSPKSPQDRDRGGHGRGE